MGILLVQILRLLEGGKRTDLAFTSLGNPMQSGRGGTHFNNILRRCNTHTVGTFEEKGHTCYPLYNVSVISVIIFCKQLRKIARFTAAKWNQAPTFKKFIIHNPVIVYVCVKSSKETLLIYDYRMDLCYTEIQTQL